MPDGRFLSKSVAHNEQLASVPLIADYLFVRCIPHLDCAGRLTGLPALIKAQVCPLRDEITPEMIPDLIRSLGEAGLIRWYEADGKKVLEFPGFKNHQKGMKLDREAASRFPSFNSRTSQDLLRPNAGPSADKLPLSEVKLSEDEVKGLNGATAHAVGEQPKKNGPEDVASIISRLPKQANNG